MSVVDVGYSSPLYDTPQIITTPNYPKPVTTSTKATWVFSVPHETKGSLGLVNATVFFAPTSRAM